MAGKKSTDHLKGLLQDDAIDIDDDSTVDLDDLLAALQKDPRFKAHIEQRAAVTFVSGMSKAIDSVMRVTKSSNENLEKSDVACAISEARACQANTGPLGAAWSTCCHNLKKEEDQVKANVPKARCAKRARKDAKHGRKDAEDPVEKKCKAANATKKPKKQKQGTENESKIELPDELTQLELDMTGDQKSQV